MYEMKTSWNSCKLQISIVNYDFINSDKFNEFTDHNRLSTGSETQNLSILSPFDEKEEWHKISEIINSFGATIGTDAAVVKESTTPNNCKYYLKISVANSQKIIIFNQIS